jgi:hypothetical protein
MCWLTGRLAPQPTMKVGDSICTNTLGFCWRASIGGKEGKGIMDKSAVC